jgi:UDPglucose 6-dehydrogenase
MDIAHSVIPQVQMMSDPYALAEGCDALMVITEWNEFKQLDLVRICGSMRHPLIFDGRNIYDPKEMESLGFSYRGVGRGYDWYKDKAGSSI